MKGLYYYKLNSPYQEDITKDCKLTITEIDHNFVTLKDADVKNLIYDSENTKLVIEKNDGTQLTTDIDLSHFTRDFRVEFDKENGILSFYHDGTVDVVEDLVSNIISNVTQEIISQTITDNTLSGVGSAIKPLSLSPLEKTGTYKAVEKVVNKLNGEELPDKTELHKGKRYLTLEPLNKYGLLYDYASVEKINKNLKGGWRVPTKTDWDNMLNAIENCLEHRNHQEITCNEELGFIAGNLLKSNKYWAEINGENADAYKGCDAYGMNILPAGYADDKQFLGYFGERTMFWTICENDKTDVFAKRFDYDKNGVVQIAETPFSFCSLRLVKDYEGGNFIGVETIEGVNYNTTLLPSLNSEFEHAVWTTANYASENPEYTFKVPNNGEFNEIIEKYYINEWDGFQWLKKPVENGDSLVILEGPDGEVNCEYQLIDNVLINVKKEFKNELNKLIESFDVEPIGEEGKYISSFAETNGIISCETKTLVQEGDKVLTYTNDGISSNITIVREEGIDDVVETFKLVGNNQEILGDVITITQDETNKTIISDDIIVAGTSLAELVKEDIDIIKNGTNLQELLTTLFHKEIYPSNLTYKEGGIFANIGEPLFTLTNENDENVHNTIVEVGTKVNISDVKANESEIITLNALFSGFDYGYSLSNNNEKEGDENPKEINPSNIQQLSKYIITRTLDGFENYNGEERLEDNVYSNISLNALSNVVVSEGENVVTVNISGASYSADFIHETQAYYACSNLGNTSELAKIETVDYSKNTEVPFNSCSLKVKGAHYSFVGVAEKDFVVNSENIRQLGKYSYDKETTCSVTGNAGNTQVIIAFPDSWGALVKVIDNNALGAFLTGNFELYEDVLVKGANDYTETKYKVYIYTSKIVLGDIDYTIIIK